MSAKPDVVHPTHTPQTHNMWSEQVCHPPGGGGGLVCWVVSTQAGTVEHGVQLRNRHTSFVKESQT